MPIETRQFDAAACLGSPEAQGEFIAAALETGDPANIASALGVVARARGEMLTPSEIEQLSKGVPYMVGERGREIFVPQQSGNIVPNGDARSVDVRVQVGVDDNGKLTAHVARVADARVAAGMRAGRATLRDEMADFQKDPWRR
jgi:hypothetical protein